MGWNHPLTLKKLAVSAINRPYPFQPLNVACHDQKGNPAFADEIEEWAGIGNYISEKTLDKIEEILGS